MDNDTASVTKAVAAAAVCEVRGCLRQQFVVQSGTEPVLERRVLRKRVSFPEGMQWGL